MVPEDPHHQDDQIYDDDSLGDVARRLDEIEAALGSMRDELAALRRALGEELRTRRLVVVEDDGFERVVISARGAFGYVAVCGRNGPRDRSRVELFANDPIDGDGTHVGVALSTRGDVVASLEVLDRHRARLWVEQRAEP
jgi:hypothetical protein